MSTVEGKKQEKRRALLDAAYELFLERGTSKTSVEDITSRAKVGKGTFYLYFADKGSVTQALLARVSYQLLDNACAAAEQHAAELTSFPDQMIFVIDHIIEALRADTLMLRFLERSFVWPGLDQIEASGEAEPLMRKVLQIVMCSPEMAGRTEREIYQRITALGSMCMSVCYSSVLSFLATYAAELQLMTAGTLFFVVYALSVTLARPVAGVMFDRKGEDFVMYPTYACLAIGLLLLSITTQNWEMLAAGVFVGLGYGTFMSNGQAICVKLVEEVRIGVAVSTYFVMLDLGLGVGPYLLGAFKEPLGFQGIYSAVGLGAIGCAVLYWLLYARRPKSADLQEDSLESLESEAE